MYTQQFLINSNNLTLNVLRNLMKCLKENNKLILLDELKFSLLEFRNDYKLSDILSDYINLWYNSVLKEIEFISDK